MLGSCIVTGANQGIGLALAEVLAKNNYLVVGLHRGSQCSPALAELKNRFPKNILTIGDLDLTNVLTFKRLKEIIFNLQLEIQYIFNVAGVSAKKFDETKKSTSNLGHLDISHFKEMFEINLFSPLFLVQELLNNLKASRYAGNCWVINISSRDASFTIKESPGNYAYCSSKAGLNMMTKCLAMELKELNIGGAIAIHPGWVRTAMGGIDGEIDAIESAKNILNLTTKLSDKLNGAFLNIDGSQHPL